MTTAPEPIDEAQPAITWMRGGGNRYRIGPVEVEYSEGALRGYVLGVSFEIPMRLVMHVIAGGPVPRTVRR